LGETLVGHQYDFSYEVGEAVITDVVVYFYDSMGEKVDELDYTVANNRITKTADLFVMENLDTSTLTITPGVYRYKTVVTFDSGLVKTIFEGKKIFEI